MDKLGEEVCQERRWKLAFSLKLCPLNNSSALNTFKGTRYLPTGRAD